MNQNKALEYARRIAKLTGDVYFVVYDPDESGDYHICDQETLDTYYHHLRDNDIIACYDPVNWK